MAIYKAAGLKQPILLGGAALTRKFVATDCAPLYPAPVVYCRDAFSGLKAIQDFEKGILESSHWEEKKLNDTRPKENKKPSVKKLETIPTPPFTGIKTIDVDPNSFLPLMNQQILFRGRWGYKRGKLDESGYQELLDNTVLPEFNALQKRVHSENLLEPKIRYGWFPCKRDSEGLIVTAKDKEFSFTLPRQRREPNQSLVDFFRTEEDGNDLVGFLL